MYKIVSIVTLTAGLFLFNAPAQAGFKAPGQAGSDCAYAITKLQAEIRYQKNVVDTTAASAAAVAAAAYDAMATSLEAKGATADAALNDAACRNAVISGWKALHG